MTAPGYRNTAPPRLFVDFSREALEAIDSGNFSLYQDPLDLKNTLKSFQYSLTKSDTPGAIQVNLINPSQQVEEKLFSWYCAVNPRTWRAQENGTTPEEWAVSAGEFAQFYLRWGYYNNSTDPQAGDEKNALSNIHRAVLFDIKYNISDSQDREVTLLFQNQYDISLIRSRNIAREGTVETYTVPLSDSPGSLRPISTLISECLAVLAAGEGSESHVILSDKQKQAINTNFDVLKARLIGRTGGEEGQLPYLDPETDTITRGGAITDVLKTFFGQLGIEVIIDSESPPSEIVGPQPLPDQTGHTGGQGDDPQATERRRQAATQAPALPTFTFSSIATGVYEDTNTNPLSLFSLSVSSMPQPVYAFAAPNPYTSDSQGNFKFDFTLEELERMKAEDRMLVLHFPTPLHGLDPSTAAAWAITILETFKNSDFSEQRIQLAVSGNIDSPVDNLDEAPSPEDLLVTNPANFYRISDDEFVKALLNATISQARSKVEEILNNQLPPDTNQETQQDIEEIEQATPEPLPPPEPQYIDGNVLRIRCTNRHAQLRKLVEKINRTHLDSVAEYININLLPVSVVPPESQGEVDSQLDSPVDWGSPATDNVVVISPDQTFEQAMSYLNSTEYIKSFDIQVQDDPAYISLATGFNKRKDNIITSLAFNINKAGFYTDITRAPIIADRLYDITERFTDLDYRDTVLRVLEVAFGEIANPEGEIFIVEFAPDEVPDEVVQRAASQAARLVEGLYSDGEQSNDLLNKVKEDLQFLRNNNLLNAFFPYSTGASNEAGVARMSVDGQVIPRETRRRYMTDSPIQALQNELSVDSPEVALALAARLRVLSNFKKRITNIKLTTLGIPELDTLSYELANRRVALWVAEPRVPGTFHWLSGVYNILDITHRLDTTKGLVTDFELIPALGVNTSEELLKASYTFLKGND